MRIYINTYYRSWAFKDKIEPIIERSINKFNQINNVVFDFAPMDKKNEH